MLERLLGELIVVDLNEAFTGTPSQDIIDGIEKLKTQFNLTDDNFLGVSRNKFKILIPRKERPKYFQDIQKLDDFIRDDINVIKYKTSTFLLKPIEAQGGKSAGKPNEAAFLEGINNSINICGGPITVILDSPQYKDTFNNVTEAVDSSTTGAGEGDKSDAQLLSGTNILANISLKKEKFLAWETLKKRWKNEFLKIANNALNNKIPPLTLKPNPDKKGKYLMYNSETGNRITLVQIDNAPKEVNEMIVFGPEEPKVIVVGNNFKEDDFILDEEKCILTVKIHHIYKTLNDVEDDNAEPVIVLMQHRNQSYGLDFRARPAYDIKKPSIVVDWGDITK